MAVWGWMHVTVEARGLAVVPVRARVRVKVRVRVGRVSVGGVSHHAKLSNPRVGAVRGLLKRTCWARAHMCTCVYVLSEEC